MGEQVTDAEFEKAIADEAARAFPDIGVDWETNEGDLFGGAISYEPDRKHFCDGARFARKLMSEPRESLPSQLPNDDEVREKANERADYHGWTNGDKQWPDYDCSVHRTAFLDGFRECYEWLTAHLGVTLTAESESAKSAAEDALRAGFDHPCRETCSGWKQGRERGEFDAKERIAELEAELRAEKMLKDAALLDRVRDRNTAKKRIDELEAELTKRRAAFEGLCRENRDLETEVTQLMDENARLKADIAHIYNAQNG